MANKLYINKKLVSLLLVIAIAIPFSLKWSQAENPGINLAQWEDVHVSRTEGECAECHSSLDYVEHKVVVGKTKVIPAPKTHTEQFLRFTHGKEEKLGSHNCVSCHKTEECVDCHSAMPESHSSDFIHPYSDTLGAQRHIALGRADTTACYTCHRTLNNECTTCHEYEETNHWQESSAKDLMRWQEILGMPF